MKVLDLPNERSLHQTPTPRIGGLAIMGSFFFGLLALGFGGVWPASQDSSLLMGWSTSTWIAGLTLLLATMSLLDDLTGLPVAVRLGVQIAAACVLAVGARLMVSDIDVPLVGTVELGSFSLVGSIVFLVWMANLYNFMDGMDGLAGGMTLLGGSVLALLAWQGHNEMILTASLLLAGAALGFLSHNFPPARIFMGDVGSVPIGFLFGSLILLGVRERLFTIWVPLILFSPFVVDATVTLIRRAFKGERIWDAHRTHYYQRLVLLGWGHRKTVLAEYGLMILCGLLAWAYHLAQDQARLVLLGCWGLLMVLLMVGIHMAERAKTPLK